ncbi:MAG: polyhydroxyalkanoate synthesis regulator DNA-binding domain-containing protein [Desulfobacterales bacterium]|jgi:polyhydroxyalkanoate synthesis repressor PhaR
MRKIKKYANRKMYDTHAKRHISRDQLAELIKQGEEVVIIDNRTGGDLTVPIVSQLIGLEGQKGDKAVSPRLLMQLLRKGSGTLTDYAKKYVSLWQGAFNMAEDEIDKLVNRLVKNDELSNEEGSRLKKEITGYSDLIKGWISDSVDKRIKEVFSALNLPTHDQMKQLSGRIDTLAKKLEQLDKAQKAMAKTAAKPNDPRKQRPKAKGKSA